MLAHIWEFYVKPECEKEFELLNGPEGKWFEFFSGSPDFQGTSFDKALEHVLKNEQLARQYLTRDVWKSQEGFEAYTTKRKQTFDKLSKSNLKLVLEKREIGWYEVSRREN